MNEQNMDRLARARAAHIVFLAAIGMTSAAALADSAVTPRRSVTKLDAGVFAIRHADAPDTNPQGNTTVVIGERAVLVIDSGYLPSSAAEDIAQIRQWTDRPVRYLLNTHWHPDHQRGNSVYADTFADLTIIAHPETVRLMAAYDAANRDRYPKRVQAMRESLASGRDASGKPLGEEEKAQMRRTVEGRSRVLAELEKSRLQLPTVTFERELNIDLGNRVVQIRHSGAGDTRGDAWAYLPQERILVTGDLLTAPVPYFFAGYPQGVTQTLRRLLELDVQAIIPGHGDVLRDQAHLRAVLEMAETIIGQVNAAVVRIGSLSARLEDVRPQIDVAQYRVRFAGDDPHSQEYFDESIEGLIRNAFYQAPK